MRVRSSFDLSRTRGRPGAGTPGTIGPGRVSQRGLVGAAAVASLISVAACSSSSTSVTSPTAARCPVDLALSPTTIEAAGGSGQIAITVNRDCTWDARSEADWIALVAPTTGQGEANLGYTVSPNAQVSARRGVVVVNERRVEVAQSAAPCRFDLSAAGGSAAAEGGNLAVSVTAQATCTWTAVSQVDWVRIDAGRGGSGSGAVTMSVAPNAGAARVGTVLVAGQAYSVSQPAAPTSSPVCTFSVSPDSESFPDNGGAGSVRVQASGPTCAWTAVSNAQWISVATPAGIGTGNARYTLTPNPGAARTGTMAVAGAIVTVTQAAAPTAAGCEYSVSPGSESFSANGGDGTARVQASNSSCAWSAVSNASWISLATSGSRGSGNVRYTVAANSGAARTGTMRVASATVTVTQAAASSPETIVVRGEVADVRGECPNLTFTVDRRLVRTNGATTFDDRCDKVKKNRDVMVWGVVQRDGSVLAVRVRED